MPLTREQIAHVLRWLRSRRLLGKLVLTGDAAVCAHGLPCYANDVDFSGTVALRPVIERHVRIVSVEKRMEYPGYGPGYVLHGVIDGVQVDFNLEPRDLWVLRYSGSVVVRSFSGVPVKVYVLERYVAGKLRRLALMKSKGLWHAAPSEIMDLVPIYRAGLSHSMVAYWARRLHAFGFCPDRGSVRRAVELAHRLMDVSYSADRLWRELSLDSGCMWASSCALKCRDHECRAHVDDLAPLLNNIPWKPMGGLLLEMHGYRVYLRDLDVGLRSTADVETLRHKCYSLPACRVFVDDVRATPDVFLGCCWVDTIPLPRRLWEVADTLEFYLVSNFSKMLRRPEDDYMVAKILAKFAALHLQGFFEQIDVGRVRSVMREVVSSGYVRSVAPVRPTRTQLMSAAFMLFYAHLPPSNLVHFDLGVVGRLVAEAVEAANRAVLGDSYEHG